MEEAYNLFQIYKKLDAQKKEAEALLADETDADMTALAQEQLDDALEQIPDIEEKVLEFRAKYPKFVDEFEKRLKYSREKLKTLK